MWSLRAQRGVVAVARVDDGVIALDAEQLAADITKQFLESAGLPGLSDSTGEPGVAGDRSGIQAEEPGTSLANSLASSRHRRWRIL
jgi:hypothetical protein